MVFRRALGTGTVYTIPTIPVTPSSPELAYTNLPLHHVFLPMLVRMSLKPAAQGDAQNIEIGQPASVALGNKALPADAVVQLVDPDGATYQFSLRTPDAAGPFTWNSQEKRLSYPGTNRPGLYIWKHKDSVLAVSNVQLPSSESPLLYRDAKSLVGNDPAAIVARSLEQFQVTLTDMSKPKPQWSKWIALVMLLLCAEALLGSLAHLWKSPAAKPALTPAPPPTPARPQAAAAPVAQQ